MAEDRFDDDGAPPADAFEQEMTDLGFEVIGGEDEDGDHASVPLRPAMVAAVQDLLAQTVQKARVMRPLYLETLIAFANIYCALTREYLRQSENVTMFQVHRDQTLEVINRMFAHLSTLSVTEDVIADATPVTDTVQ